MPFTILPPAEKLPLSARRDVRDSFESKKEGLEKQLSEVCGEAWTIDISPNAIYPYAPEDSYVHNALGAALAGYVDGAIYELKRFREHNGDAGMQDLNTICHARTLTMAPDEAEKFLYNGVDVDSAGRLRMLFNPEKLGVNIGDCFNDDKLSNALDATPLPEDSGSVLTHKAKISVENGFNSKVEDLRSSISDIVKNPDIKITVNFDETYQKLKTARDSGVSMAVDNFDENLGNLTAEYLASLAGSLKSKGFDKDEMLQEGFNEAISKGEIAFRVVDSIKGGSGECAIEDGVLFLQCTPEKWGSNISDIANDLIDLL
ncbi:hypothetical protein GMORB2_1239 [Geosmithia morbida]|uniref:Uncharacterized protein n=1 Tax=Geosmithia morbida TaxID=1094350 RepID=A0A9P4YZM0_9HYPO|nr:uncharacterized protein GMORB2_1239 [Geosmithia morbida]KAF4125993.1 hypothetical protein GMORB2_1239 [Geosmithia morbida]